MAVLLVVLYHAGAPASTGGYRRCRRVLRHLRLRHHRPVAPGAAATGRTSILDFYARRCRRILPAATLVIVVTVVVTYLFLGVVTGNTAAVTGGGLRYSSPISTSSRVGTNYLTATAPPSPLQNYWSLSVEEQFYIVYPTLFLVDGAAPVEFSLRSRLAALLAVGHRRLVRAVGRPDGPRPVGGLLLTLHPGLGAGARGVDRRRHPWLRRLPARSPPR